MKQRLSYGERAELAHHPLTKRLFSLMEEKKTNLSLSADVTSSKQLIQLADEVGPSLAVLKTHIDIVDDFTLELPKRLRELADQHNFLLFEDHKFADIGNTVAHQYGHGLYQIAQWADLINAHLLPGPGIIEGLRSIGLPKGRGLLLLAEMSSQGNLATGDYSKKVLQAANEYDDFVVGLITQTKFLQDPSMIHMTPGIKLQQGGDSLGQQYNSPDYVIGELGSDIAIVGRGILNAQNPKETAKLYQKICWEAYSSKLALSSNC